MTGWQRGSVTALLFLAGVCALVSGTVGAVVAGSEMLGMALQILLALLTYVPLLSAPNPRPVPEFDFFWPSIAVAGGVLTSSLGWVLIIRGTTLAWPRRFRKSGEQDSS